MKSRKDITKVLVQHYQKARKKEKANHHAADIYPFMIRKYNISS